MPLTLHRREFGSDQFSVHDGELYVGRIYKTRQGNWYWGLDQFSAGSMNGHVETPDEAMTALVSAWKAATGETPVNGMTKGPLETGPPATHNAPMANSDEEPVILPFQDKDGTGWHVVIRYHAGHERRIDGFATEAEAMDWIIANATQVDK